MNATAARPAPAARFARFAFLLTVAAALLILLSGPLTRFGVIDWRPALGLMRNATMAAIAGTLLCLIAAILAARRPGRPGLRRAALGLVIGLLAIAGPLMLMRKATSVPPIHDISTDTQDPPQFVAIAPLRADAANPVAYAGPEVAAQQAKAYPDLRPIVLDAAPADAVRRVEAAARDLGWELVAAVPADGRVEATDTTAWWGFKDDVVVRVRPGPTPGASTVDVRSKSRVGVSDIGANADRIRALRERLQG
jgi:uncharacterized protein (DUF1499 family)